MQQKRKQNPINRRRFIIGWALVWYLAVFLPWIVIDWVSYSTPSSFSDFLYSMPVYVLAYFTLLTILQVILVRHYLHTEIRHWLLLALLGFIVGQIGLHLFEANVEYVFPPAVILRLKEPENIAWLRFALYDIASHFLRWSVPLVFQWLALRKRFRHHGLWLLAALISAPYHFFAFHGSGGIFGQVLDLLEHLTGLSLVQSLGAIALLLDSAVPTVMMGVVLLYIVVKNNRLNASQQ